MLICPLLQYFVLLPFKQRCNNLQFKTTFSFWSSFGESNDQKDNLWCNWILFMEQRLFRDKKMSNSCENSHMFLTKENTVDSISKHRYLQAKYATRGFEPFMLKIYDTSLYWLSCIEYSSPIVFKNMGWPRQDLNLLPHGRTRTCNSQPRLVRCHYVSWRSTRELRGR